MSHATLAWAAGQMPELAHALYTYTACHSLSGAVCLGSHHDHDGGAGARSGRTLPPAKLCAGSVHSSHRALALACVCCWAGLGWQVAGGALLRRARRARAGCVLHALLRAPQPRAAGEREAPTARRRPQRQGASDDAAVHARTAEGGPAAHPPAVSPHTATCPSRRMQRQLQPCSACTWADAGRSHAMAQAQHLHALPTAPHSFQHLHLRCMSGRARCVAAHGRRWRTW